MSNFLIKFGERLKSERQRLGLNQLEFGAIGDVNKNTQMGYELGKRPPDVAYLNKISDAGVDVSYVLTGNLLQGVLLEEESFLVSRFRMLDQRGKAGVFGLMLGISAPVHKATFFGETGQVILGNQTVSVKRDFIVGGKKVRKN